MGHILDTLTIEPIGPMSESNTFTLSEDVVRQIIMGFGITEDKAVKDATSSIINSLSPSFKARTHSITHRIHCEALLLKHHFLNPAFSPFSYIGVSKLSCYPCYALFHAFNKSVGPGEPKYFTKGCHSKLYPKWVLAKFASMDSSIRKCLVKEHFGVALKEWLKMQLDSQCGSDSTNASTTSDGTELWEGEDLSQEVDHRLGL